MIVRTLGILALRLAACASGAELVLWLEIDPLMIVTAMVDACVDTRAAQRALA